MPLPPPTYEPEFSVASIVTGINIRSNLGSEESLRELGESLVARVLQPVGINLVDSVAHLVWGGRRVAASRLVGLKTLPAMVYRGLTDQQARIAAAIENLQREAMSEQDTYLFCAALEADGMSRKDIADAIRKSAATVTKYLSPNDSPPAAKEAFLAARITLGQVYKITTSPDPLATLALFQNGGTREQAERATRKPKTDLVRTKKILCPLPSGQVITVAGDEISLEDAIESLGEAVKLLKAAVAKGLNAKTAQSVWRDIAAAS